MTDVTRPEGQRFKRVLSGMMNFAKFRWVGGVTETHAHLCRGAWLIAC
jgi:hypothetical protein